MEEEQQKLCGKIFLILKNLLLRLWVCGRQASEWGKIVGNMVSLSIIFPHASQNTGCSAGAVHISTSEFFA